jgi:ribosomal protein L2
LFDAAGDPPAGPLRAVRRFEKARRADDGDAIARKLEIVRAFDFRVLSIERQDADLLARVARVEHDEAVEHRDERTVIEVAEFGIALNLSGRK